MEILMVRIKVKPEHLDEFIVEMIGDAEGSVMNEPGCRRFDIVQDMDDPTSLALCEVYNDDAAIDDHRSRPHYARWREATADMHAEPVQVSKCKPVFPTGDAQWDSHRPDAVAHTAFERGLHIIHAPLPIKPERVDDFIESLKGDAIGSTREEPGCLRFDVYQNEENPAELYLYEVYVNQAAFDYHTKTPHIEEWRKTVENWYSGERVGGRRGANIWPPDNWNWSSGKPSH